MIEGCEKCFGTGTVNLGMAICPDCNGKPISRQLAKRLQFRGRVTWPDIAGLIQTVITLYDEQEERDAAMGERE